MTGPERELAMFPLGSVLFPHMPLQLRVFEPRYLEMLASVFTKADRQFGVVLIERGSEVGGGDVRFDVGTAARIVSLEQAAGSLVLLAVGTARFEVVRWLQDEPFPLALVRDLGELRLDDTTGAELEAVETLVRSTAARASEFIELTWPAGVELSPDLAERIWQLAGIAPLNSLDQYALLRSATAAELLARLVDETEAAKNLYSTGWGFGSDEDDPLS